MVVVYHCLLQSNIPAFTWSKTEKNHTTMPIRITGTNDKMTWIVMLDSKNVVHLHVFNHKYLHYHPPLITLHINVPICTRVHKTVKHNHQPCHFSWTICLHGTTRLPLDRCSWNLKFQNFSKIFWENLTFITIQWERDTWHEDLCTFITSGSILLRIIHVLYKSSPVNQNIFYNE